MCEQNENNQQGLLKQPEIRKWEASITLGLKNAEDILLTLQWLLMRTDTSYSRRAAVLEAPAMLEMWPESAREGKKHPDLFPVSNL